jgi:hypothetical protein
LIGFMSSWGERGFHTQAEYASLNLNCKGLLFDGLK